MKSKIDDFSVSVIICTLNRPDKILNCIRSVRIQNVLPKEIIVVDAGNVEGLENSIKDLIGKSPIDFIYTHEKPSTTFQRNKGVDLSTGEILVFLDDDVILEEDFIKEIINVYILKRNNNVGGVRGIFTNPPKNLKIREKFFRQIFLLGERRSDGVSRLKRSGFPLYIQRPKAITRCEIMPATACSYKRDVFVQYKFDETLKGYVFGEDMDLSTRVSKKYNLFVTPHAKFFHDQPYSSKNDSYREVMVVYYIHYFFKKNIRQSLINKICHYWALTGYITRKLLISIIKKDSNLIQSVLKEVNAVMKGEFD